MPQKPEKIWFSETDSLKEDHVVLWVGQLRRNPDPRFPDDFQAQILLGRLPDIDGTPEVLLRKTTITERLWTSVGNLPVFQPGDVWREGIRRRRLFSCERVFSVPGNQDTLYPVFGKVPGGKNDHVLGFTSFKYQY